MPLKTWLARDLLKLKVSVQIKYDSLVYCDYFNPARLSVIPSHSLWLSMLHSLHFLPTAHPTSDSPGRKVSFNTLVLPLLPFIFLSAFLCAPDNKFGFRSSPVLKGRDAQPKWIRYWGEEEFSSLPFSSWNDIEAVPAWERKCVVGIFIYLFTHAKADQRSAALCIFLVSSGMSPWSSDVKGKSLVLSP